MLGVVCTVRSRVFIVNVILELIHLLQLSPLDFHRQMSELEEMYEGDDEPIETLDIQDLCGWAIISHKYLLQSYERWAICVIKSRHSRAPATLTACSQDIFEEIIRLSDRVGDSVLRTMLENAWISRLEDVASPEPFSRALEIGQQLLSSFFLGRVYYRAMVAICKLPPGSADEQLFRDGLGDVHIARINAGTVSLIRHWDHLCHDNLGRWLLHRPVWLREEIQRYLTADILGKLHHVRSVVQDTEFTWNTTYSMRAADVDKLIEDIHHLLLSVFR